MTSRRGAVAFHTLLEHPEGACSIGSFSGSLSASRGAVEKCAGSSPYPRQDDVTGALDIGGDTEEVFETLHSEVGRLYHQRKALRSAMMVYVAVGWTTALLIIGIMLAVNGNVLDGYSQLSAVSETGGGVAIDPNAIDLARDRWRFYVVTQATMLACGWFAGVASRDRYEALLHSAALVAICHLVFAGTGMI